MLILELEPVTIISSTYLSMSKIPHKDLKTKREESALLEKPETKEIHG